jgi:hypothetical protein
MLELITSVTERPTYAQAYCVERFPILRTTPPAIANKTEGKLSFITKFIQSQPTAKEQIDVLIESFLHITKIANLTELSEEIGHVVLGLPKLAEGKSDKDRGEEVRYRVVEVGVLRKASPAFQEGEHGWPCAQEKE